MTKLTPWLFACAALVGGCGATLGYDSRAGSYAGLPYPYYPYPYYDWFAQGTDPQQRGPTYHWYPNLEYFLEYRPIYPT